MIKRPRWLERRLRDRLTERKYYSAMDHWTQHWETARYCTNPALLPRKKRILSYSRIVEPTRGSTRIYFIMSIFLTHVNIFDAFRRPSSMRGILKGKKLILVQVSTQRCREPTRMSFFYLEGENETEKNETCSFFFLFQNPTILQLLSIHVGQTLGARGERTRNFSSLTVSRLVL